MVICDSHCHVSTAWFGPAESLLHEMDRHGVDRAVLVQIRGQLDNCYQRDCVRRFPGRFASVVLAGSPEQLAREADLGAVGVRLWPDSPPALWETAARLGLAVSCAGSAEAFASRAFARLVDQLPRLRIVLEHYAGLERLGLGGRTREQGAGDENDPHVAARGQVLALARYPNVLVKLHGLGEFCIRAMPVTEPFPFVRPIPSLIGQLLDAFGPGRLMWASDYPPVQMREGYANALRLVMGEVPEPHRATVFGRTALETFSVAA
ncbi:MAG TPA: amidohydrolase family protein [Chloroflexota bacterium]|jgi:L-fuconolactonase